MPDNKQPGYISWLAVIIAIMLVISYAMIIADGPHGEITRRIL